MFTGKLSFAWNLLMHESQFIFAKSERDRQWFYFLFFKSGKVEKHVLDHFKFPCSQITNYFPCYLSSTTHRAPSPQTSQLPQRCWLDGTRGFIPLGNTGDPHTDLLQIWNDCLLFFCWVFFFFHWTFLFVDVTSVKFTDILCVYARFVRSRNARR